MPTLDSVRRKLKNMVQVNAEIVVNAQRFEGTIVENENDNGAVSTFVINADGTQEFNRLWCQLKDEPNPVIVWAHKIQPRKDAPVWVVDKGDGYEIEGIRAKAGTEFYEEGLGSIDTPIVFNEIWPFSLTARNYRPGQVIKSIQGGLWVQILPFRYFRKDGTPVTFMGSEIDLTAYLPGTSGTWAWLGLCVDPATNEPAVVTGNEYAGPALLTDDLVDNLDTYGLIPVDAIKMQNGATEITGENEFVFGRVFTQHHPRHNFDATTAPTTGDDDTLGYEVGSIWVNVSSGAVYFCADASTGAAVWTGSSVPTLYYQTIEDNGTPLTQRATLNFIDGEGTAVTATDNDPDTDVTVDLDIDGLTADATPNGAEDYVATWDASAGTHKKVLLDDLPGGGGSSYYQTIEDGGTPLTQRPTVNFIAGTNISLTIADDAPNTRTNITIDATGGGGSATGTIWEPRAAPASPSASDDEFADASSGVPTGFTEIDFGTNTTVSEDVQGLLLTQTTHAGNSVAGVYKAIPDANFSIWTRVAQIIPFTTTGGGTATKIGLALYQDATDSAADMFTFHLDFGSSATIGYQGIRYTAYNGSATGVFGVVGGNLASGLPSTYMRIRFDGTTYYCDFSVDGYTVLQAGLVTAATLGYTPLHMGLMINNVNTGSTVSGLFQFFRYAASDVGVVPMSGRRVNYFV